MFMSIHHECLPPTATDIHSYTMWPLIPQFSLVTKPPPETILNVVVEPGWESECQEYLKRKRKPELHHLPPIQRSYTAHAQYITRMRIGWRSTFFYASCTLHSSVPFKVW